MKRVLLTFFILTALSAAVFSQEAEITEAETGTADTGPALTKMEKFQRAIAGLSLGLTAGTHEFPLKEWYEDEDSASIRSFYLKPDITYSRAVQDFDLYVRLNSTFEFGAPDMSPGARAPNAKEADRKNWISMYSEEEFAFRMPIRIPPVFSVYFNNQNNFYFTPKFEAVPGVSDEDGRIVDGRFEPGFGYNQVTERYGTFHAKIGVPMDYYARFQEDFGLGMMLNFGYEDGAGIGPSSEVTVTLAFLPAAEYRKTELNLNYAWQDFIAGLKLTIYRADSVSIAPELRYHIGQAQFSMGLEFSGIGANYAFAPFVGFAWKEGVPFQAARRGLYPTPWGN